VLSFANSQIGWHQIASENDAPSAIGIEALETSPSMIYRVRKQLVEEGLGRVEPQAALGCAGAVTTPASSCTPSTSSS
jgi:hypothetical protein